MRQRPQHFVLSGILRSQIPAYDAVNVALYFVYATLTVAPDFELEPVETVHLIDMFADRKKQPFASVESSCGREDEIDTWYLWWKTETGRSP